MKKTLITFLALAGLATASIEGNWNGTISREESSLSFSNLPENSPITLSIVSSNISNYKSPSLTHDGQDLSTTYTPDTNVGTSTPWVLTFTIKNNTEDETFYLTHFTFDTFTFNGDGGWQANGRKVTLALSIDGGGAIGTGIYDTTSWNGVSGETGTAQNSGDTSQDVLIYTGGANLKLNAGESLTFNLEASSSAATYAGMSNVTVRTEYIPEPATATLSLLALCGLAARRRRK